MSKKFLTVNGKFLKSNGKLVSGNEPGPGPTPVYPTKGQLITMNLGNETPAAGTNNQYRVLSINGSVAEVVAMYDMPNITFNEALYENIYAGGELDTYLNTTFYDSLSSTAKSAIVDKNITQYEYTYNSSIYSADTHASYADYSTKASKAVVGSRHVYALDVEDIETYFNNTFSTANIWTLFWNTTAKPSTVTYPWLRSARADRSDAAWRVNGNLGGVNRNSVDSRDAARPALTIDLSKISWSPVVSSHTLTPTFTNVTGQPSSAIQVQSGGSQTFTLSADGTSYKLPTKITVASTEVTAGTETVITNKCTVLFTRTSDTNGTIAFSNVTDDVAFSVVGEAIASYPAKGDIITIESKRYRVLDISGSHAKLFGLFDAVTTAFGTAGSSNVYAGSTLDTALNTTWFGQQSATFQNAVDDSSITTSTYQYSDEEPASWTYEYDYNWTPSDPEYATRTATTSAITRKVYALDLKDYYDYKGTNTTTSNDLMKFFFEGDGSEGSYSDKYCWLRSAFADDSSDAWYVYGSGGDVDYNGVYGYFAARPALTIDLSKISWS